VTNNAVTANCCNPQFVGSNPTGVKSFVFSESLFYSRLTELFVDGTPTSYISATFDTDSQRVDFDVSEGITVNKGNHFSNTIINLAYYYYRDAGWYHPSSPFLEFPDYSTTGFDITQGGVNNALFLDISTTSTSVVVNAEIYKVNTGGGNMNQLKTVPANTRQIVTFAFADNAPYSENPATFPYNAIMYYRFQFWADTDFSVHNVYFGRAGIDHVQPCLPICGDLESNSITPATLTIPGQGYSFSLSSTCSASNYAIFSFNSESNLSLIILSSSFSLASNSLNSLNFCIF